MSAPIAGLDGFETSDRSYPDPGELLVDDDETFAPPRMPETEGRWSEIVHLIIRGLQTAGEARRRAASRLVPLTLWGRLTEHETELVAQAIWLADCTNQNSLPDGTSLYDWVLLLLPEPKPGLAEQLFRRKWLIPQEVKNEKGYNEFFWQVGNARSSLRRHQHPLMHTSGERANLSAIVEKWIKLPVTAEGNPARTKCDKSRES